MQNSTKPEFFLVESDVLEEIIGIARTLQGLAVMKEKHPKLITYKPREVRLLTDETEEMIKAVHVVKRIVGGTLVK